MKEKWKKVKDFWKEYKAGFLFFTIMISVVVGVEFGTTYLCKHPEKRNISYYGDENYYICIVIAGSGRSTSSYYGAVSKNDYNKWVNGENGTIFVVNSHNKDRGWRLNIDSITTISVCDNDWIPLNF